MIYSDVERVSKYWEKEIYLEKNIDLEIAKKILYLKRKCLHKVQTQEWTIEEYKQFTNVVKKMKLYAFTNFYDLADAYLDLTKEECYEEMQYLNSTGLIHPTTKNNCFYELMAQSIYELRGKILGLGRIEIIEETGDHIQKFEKEITMYEDILAQLKDSNSQYYNSLKEVFELFIHKSVKNPQLKEKILNMEYMIINPNISYVRKRLAILNKQMSSFKNHVGNAHCKEIAVTYSKTNQV